MHRVARLFPDMTTQQFDELVVDIEKNGQIEPILTCSGKIADGRHRWRACRKLKIEPKIVRWEDVRPGKDASLVDYVIARNLRRRHLTKSQRAAIATKALPLYEAEAQAKKKVAAVKGGKASADARKKKPEAGNLPAKLQEGSGPKATENKEVSETPEAKKSKKTPKDRTQESTAKAAKQAGVSPRYVAEAAAIKKKSPALHKLVEDGAVSIPLAKKIAELDPKHLQMVLRDGKRVGYKKAHREFLDQYRPGTESNPTEHDIANKLRQATRQAEALNKTLEAAVEMAQHHKIEQGPGLKKLIGLTENAHTLAQKITG